MYDRATGGATAVPVARAALALHEPDLGVDEILRRLGDLATEVGPADAVALFAVDAPLPPDRVAFDVTATGMRLAFRADDDVAARIKVLVAHAALAIAN